MPQDIHQPDQSEEHIRQLLESVLADVDDSTARYKLRTAIQFLDVVEQRRHDLLESLEDDTLLTEDLKARLEELGYR